MKRPLILSFSIILLAIMIKPDLRQTTIVQPVERIVITPTQQGKKKTLDERAMFNEARLLEEYYKQVNPITGTISMSEKQLEFLQAREAQLSINTENSRTLESAFINRGPTNLGGRTRSLVIDRNDNTGNTMLAGAVSGGVFRTTNGGASWTKVSSNDEVHSVTAIVQDPRTGFENNWYYGTGEFLGNSAGLNGSPFRGQGIWQSTDNGLSWTQLVSTDSAEDVWDSRFDYNMRMAIHPISGDLYVANTGAIQRFDGVNWFIELENLPAPPGQNSFILTDIVISDLGRVYAAFDGNAQTTMEGVWTSATGIGGWSRINATDFTPTGRVVLALAPSNQDKLYTLYVNGNTSSCTGPVQEADLWLWDQSTLTYTDYTDVLPFEGGCLPSNDPFSVQGGYDLVVSVKPDDENFVVIGGTNAYKKEDITDNSSRFIRIGGYFSDSQYGYYNAGTGVDHHPDIQDFVFSPSNPNVLFSATDGGLHRTDDVTQATVGWQNLNNFYQTHQFYHVAIDPLMDSDIVLGGAQDNGTNIGGTDFGLPDLTTQTLVGGGDGVAVAISRDEGCFSGFGGTQLGQIAFLDCFGTITTVTPTGSTSQFVTYFYLDPDNNNALYYAGQNTLYRTIDATNVTSGTWDNMSDTSTAFGHTDYFKTFSTSNGTYDPMTSYLLMGGDKGHIYRLNDPWNATDISMASDITPSGATLAFPSIVTGLAIHPTNNDIVLATYSNYGTNSIFLTTNATSATPSWTLVERNLSAHSVRSAAISEVNGETLYFVGTSRGLYSTSDPTTEDWVREAPDQIGFAVVSSLPYRHNDNHLLIGTHGNGMYEAIITQTLSVDEFDINNAIKLYPNPTTDNLHIQFPSHLEFNGTFSIKNTLGQTIFKGQLENNTVNVSKLQSGMYFIQLEVNGRLYAKRFIKK